MHHFSLESVQTLDIRPGNMIQTSSRHYQYIRNILEDFSIWFSDLDVPFSFRFVESAGLDFVLEFYEAVDRVLFHGAFEVGLDFSGGRVEGGPVWVGVEGVLVGVCWEVLLAS